MSGEEHHNLASEGEFARLLEEKRPDDIAHYHWPAALLRVASNTRSYSEAESVMRSYYAQQVLRHVEYGDFLRAVHVDTYDAYEMFLKKWPNGVFAPVVAEKLETADENAWETACRRNTIEAYKIYLKKFPRGKYVQDAHIRIEQIACAEAWEAAKQKDTLEAYEVYIERFPRGKHVQEARERIEQIAQSAEEQAWKAARKRDTIEAYQAYVSKFPQGKYVQEALERLEQLKEKLKQLREEVQALEAAHVEIEQIEHNEQPPIYELFETIFGGTAILSFVSLIAGLLVDDNQLAGITKSIWIASSALSFFISVFILIFLKKIMNLLFKMGNNILIFVMFMFIILPAIVAYLYSSMFIISMIVLIISLFMFMFGVVDSDDFVSNIGFLWLVLEVFAILMLIFYIISSLMY